MFTLVILKVESFRIFISRNKNCLALDVCWSILASLMNKQNISKTYAWIRIRYFLKFEPEIYGGLVISYLGTLDTVQSLCKILGKNLFIFSRIFQ